MLEWVIDKVDLVLIMSVNPGFGGQGFIDSALRKIEQARRLIDASGRDIRLEVDGGIKVDNIARAAAAGADTFVAGSAIFGQPDYKAVIDVDARRRCATDARRPGYRRSMRRASTTDVVVRLTPSMAPISSSSASSRAVRLGAQQRQVVELAADAAQLAQFGQRRQALGDQPRGLRAGGDADIGLDAAVGLVLRQPHRVADDHDCFSSRARRASTVVRATPSWRARSAALLRALACSSAIRRRSSVSSSEAAMAADCVAAGSPGNRGVGRRARGNNPLPGRRPSWPTFAS